MKKAIVAVFLLLTGCGQEARLPSPQDAAKTARPETKPAAPPQPGGQSQAIPPGMRMVIRTATISLVVDSVIEHLNRAVDIIEKQGGYVAESRQWREAGQLRATASLRIPAEKLAPALQEIRKDVIRVGSETIAGQDVSEEYADLGAQLTNLRAAETELRQLLVTVREHTQKASEVLEVYSQLSKVRGDIDRLQGRADYLKQMTAMSTIQLELIPDQLSEPIIEPGWRPAAIAKTAARTLVASLKAIGAVLIWLVVFIVPIAAVLGLLTFAGLSIWRVLGHRRRANGPPPPAA